MNAIGRKAAWGWTAPPVKRRARQLGFVRYEPRRWPGVPARVANAHARFEDAARGALREWLMV